MEAKANVEKISAEISRLEEQRNAVEAEAERAAERLKELRARKSALTSGVSWGEKRAAKELRALVEALEEEAAIFSRTKNLAEEAIRELDRLVLEAEVRYREEEKRLAWGRYEALCRERYSLDEEAEEAMARLIGVLRRLESLHEDQIRAINDAENSYPAQQDPRNMIEHWLARRLRRWLPNGSFEKYDAPLSEIDPLAQKGQDE